MDDDKIDPEAALSPIVERRFAEYMLGKSVRSDGSRRSADNWQKGFPRDSYMKSLKRHVLDIWLLHRGYETDTTLDVALCAALFNVAGYLHVVLSDGDDDPAVSQRAGLAEIPRLRGLG
jgi:hypothetical protein